MKKDSSVQKLPAIGRPASQKSLTSHNEFGPPGDHVLGQSKTTKNLLNYKSPFKIPSDDEVFQYCEMERVKKEEKKRDIQELNIWDIKTATCRNPLKHYKNFQAAIDEKHVTQKAYKENERLLIQQALEIANERKKNKDKAKEKKESIVETLEQKKEMFLVTMAHDIIENEIVRLQNISQDRDKALSQSERLLQMDQENFTQYTENNKKEQEEMEKNAEAAAKERKDIEAQIKSIQVKQASIKSEKTRLEESLQTYKEHKKFLDKIAGKEWTEEKEKKLDELKRAWIKQYKELNKDKKKFKNEQEIEEIFKKKVEREEIPAIVEFEDNYKLAFDHPKQLIDCFEKLQQDQLSAIKIKQEDEEEMEGIKKEQQRINQTQKKKVNELRAQQEMIQKQIEDVKNQIREMKLKSTSSSSLGSHEEKIKKIAKEIYGIFKEEAQNDNVEQSSTQYLSKIENHIEQQLRELDQFYALSEQRQDPKFIKIINDEKKQAEKSRKIHQREQTKQDNEKIQMEKNKKNKDKMHEQSKKRIGRVDMRRSDPLYEEVQEVKQEQDNKEEDDKKYFSNDYVMCVDKDSYQY